MAMYQHILLAVDFFEHDQIVIDRAKALADSYQAKLSLIHVVDNTPMVDAGYGDMPYPIDLGNELMAIAQAKLHKLAAALAVAEADIWLESGSAHQEIVRVAQEQQADLLVVGSHGRHGLALLLGSTANSILHHARCDVLAVRLPDQPAA